MFYNYGGSTFGVSGLPENETKTCPACLLKTNSYNNYCPRCFTNLDTGEPWGDPQNPPQYMSEKYCTRCGTDNIGSNGVSVLDPPDGMGYQWCRDCVIEVKNGRKVKIFVPKNINVSWVPNQKNISKSAPPTGSNYWGAFKLVLIVLGVILAFSMFASIFTERDPNGGNKLTIIGRFIVTLLCMGAPFLVGMFMFKNSQTIARGTTNDQSYANQEKARKRGESTIQWFVLYCVMFGAFFGVCFTVFGLKWFHSTLFSLLASNAFIISFRYITRSRFILNLVKAALQKLEYPLTPAEKTKKIQMLIEDLPEVYGIQDKSASNNEYELGLIWLLSVIPFGVLCSNLLSPFFSLPLVCFVTFLFAITCSTILCIIVNRTASHGAIFKKVKDLIKKHPEVSWANMMEVWNNRRATENNSSKKPAGTTPRS